jgi:hypothetical protein
MIRALQQQGQFSIHSPARIRFQAMYPASALSTAQLAIYAVLSPPTIYNPYRYGKRGLLGWLYLLVFCVRRMTSSGIFLSNPASNGATVILNIELSPLLLVMLGIMHEG